MSSAQKTRRPINRFAIVVAVTLVISSGCTSLMTPISGVPAHRLPPQFLAQPKNNLVPVDVARLRQDAPREYLVDAEDILGIYIEGVLGSSDEPPPVHMPDRFSDLPPSIGYPIPVREDGTLALPLVPPLAVRGLSLAQVENIIRRAYTIDSSVLKPGKDRIIVTLMHALKKRGLKRGVAALCIGGGEATAVAIEML